MSDQREVDSPAYHLRCIQSALEQALAYIRREIPKGGESHRETEAETLVRVRIALLAHIPELRKVFSDGQ